ncbi:MAG: T9SS type A sorting domain-containing protein [Raineya sp.]|jgi:hypothetical protein|nr:T9SS type A sorting domain-containing protein [Raineya sp.]
MKQYLSQQYKSTISKYKKFKARFEKTVQNGVSNKKRRDLFQRLRKLYSQITRLETQLKLAISAGTLSLALVATPNTQVVAQNVAGGKYKYFQRELGLPKGDFDQAVLTGYQVYPTFADLDNDGDNDLILGLYDGGAVFYQKNINSAGETEYTLIPNDNDASPFKGAGLENYTYFSPTFADIDNDGDLDLVAGYVDGGYGLVTLFKNVNGKFVHFDGYANPFASVYTYNNAGVGGPRPAFLDADNDGDLDLFVSGNKEDKYAVIVKYYENDGENTGIFIERTGTANPLGFVNIGTTYGTYYTGYGSLTFADVDNDGDMDAYIGEKYGSVYEFKNDGSNTFAPGTLHPTLSFPTSETNPQPAFQDMDEDGDLDCLVGDKAFATLPYHKNNGSGVFARTPNINDVTDFSIQNPPNLLLERFAYTAIADIDKDNDQDFITTDFYGEIRYFSSNGDGSFEEITTGSPFATISGTNYIPTLDFVDMDGDGDQDLVIKDYYTNYPKYYRNDGTIFVEVTGVANPFNSINLSGVAGMDVVDFDNDGDFDLLAGDTNGLKLFVNGGGSFTLATGAANPFADIFTGITGSYQYISPALVDIDGDDDLDFVFGTFNNLDNPATTTNPDFNRTKINYYLNDSGVYKRVSDTDSPFPMTAARFATPTFGDMDGDEDLDLLVGEFAGAARVRYFERAGNNSCAKIDEIRHEIAVNNNYTFLTQEFKDVYNDEPDTKYKDFPKIKIIAPPQFGVLKAAGNIVNPGTEINYADLGELVYIPNKDYTGLDAFSWAAFDPIGQCYSAASYARFGIGVDVTALDDELGKYVKVYPNPTQGTFNIAFDKILSGKVELKLYNAVGALLKTYSYENPSDIQSINLENMPKGLYVLRINNDGKVGSIKVIKD